jgi:hypothetical protein
MNDSGPPTHTFRSRRSRNRRLYPRPYLTIQYVSSSRLLFSSHHLSVASGSSPQFPILLLTLSSWAR